MRANNCAAMNILAHRELFSRSFGIQQLREGQLVGRMLPQRLATGATGVKQARYRRGPTRERGTRTRMRSVYKRTIMCMCVGPWHLLFKCESVRQCMV